MRSTSAPCISFSRHVRLPLLGFVLAAFAIEVTGFDLWLADRIYALSGNSWSLREAWLTQTMIHEGGRLVVTLLASALLGSAVASLVMPSLARWRRGIWYLLASSVASALTISVLKDLTHVDCPWDLLRYGGDLPYVRIFAPHPRSFEYGACFPAGHASAAYAWLGAYYVAHEYAPRWKGRVLAVVLGAGVLFGFAQQLRGAHFISHDLWTLGICWCCATALYALFFREENWCPGQESNLRPAP
jgi:membrane-associated PAP2 superfamily phosphatase